MDIDDLKKEYEKLEKKYSLPKFKELNENFEIEKIDKETEILLKSVRKIMMEKLLYLLGFAEMLLNPMNAPRMYHTYLKFMTTEDQESLNKIYETLAKLSLTSLELEIIYNEKAEADLIKTVNKSWNDLKDDFQKVIKKMQNPQSNGAKRERNYFG